jgi:hypothetical protein
LVVNVAAKKKRTQENITMNRLSSALGLVAMSALVAACGGLAGDTKAYPSLATLKGQITNTQSIQTVTKATPDGDVRVAVVWVGEVADSYNVAVDVPVQAVFPSEFQIQLTQAPPDNTIATNKNAKTSSSSAEPPTSTPTAGTDTGNTSSSAPSSGGSGPTPSGSNGAGASALSKIAANASSNANTIRPANFSQKNWPDGFGIAVGAVVAYQDLNGNGKLDLVDPSATQYVDRILGANDSLLLVYVQGDVPPVVDFMDDAGRLPQKGYNLFRYQSCTTPLNAGSGSSGECKSTMTWLTMDTLYELPLSDDPKFSQIMCATQSGFDSSGSSDVTVSGGTNGNAGSGGVSGGGGGTGGPVPVADGGSFMDDAGTDDAGAIDAGPAPDAGDSDGGAAMLDSGAPSDAGSKTGPAVPGYPSPTDPNLHCTNGGKSFYYTMCDSTPQPVTQPTGLCGSTTTVSDVAPCAAQIVDMPTPEPSNWPCPLQ